MCDILLQYTGGPLLWFGHERLGNIRRMYKMNIIESITKEDIQELARYIIDQGNFIEVSMVPAE